MTINADGFAAVYAIHTSHAAVRKRNGVPMTDSEDRLRVRLTERGGAARWVAVTVNGNGKCVVHGTAIDETQYAACKVAALPAPSPSPKQDFPCPDGLKDTAPLCGSVSVGLDLLQTVLTPVPSAETTRDTFDVCVEAVPGGVAESAIAAQCQDPPSHASGTGGAGSFSVAVDYVDQSPARWRLRGQLGNANAKSSDTSGTRAGSAASTLRHVEAASGSSASGSGSANGSNGIGGLATLVHPFSYDVRGSLQYQNSKLITSSDKQTSQALSNVSGQLAADQSGTKIASTTDNNDSFQSIDKARLFGVIQRPFVRGGVTPNSATKPSGNFDYTDLIDLAPFDPSKINTVTYGGKLVWAPSTSVFAAGYYRDYDKGASGTLLHGEGTFGNVVAGVSEVVANSNTASSNLYLTTGPDGTGTQRTHSSNTVLGVLVPFGTGDSWQVFTRLGAMTTGNDGLGMLSWSSPGGGRLVRDDGSVISFHALAGYRAIDPVYDPLATAYDPFTGTQLAFARTGVKYVQPGTKTDVTTSLFLSAARGKEGARPVYSSVGIGATYPIALGPFSLSLNAARSTIAGCVAARTDGAVVVSGTNATTLLDNSFVGGSIVYAPNGLLTISLGNASAHTVTCDKKTRTCSSKLTNGRNGIIGSLLAGFQPGSPTFGTVIFDGSLQPGSVTTADASGATIPTNTLKASLLAAYHVCTDDWTGIEPTVSYKNQIQRDVSTFAPGMTLEAAIDVGFSRKNPFLSTVAARFSTERQYPAPGQTVNGSTNRVDVKLVSPPRWQQYSKLDRCATTKK